MRWVFAGGILFFGLITIDLDSWKWSLLSVSLFALPLLAQFARSQEVRVWALWLGVFLVLQSLLSPVIIDRDFKTLPPRMHEVLDVKSGIPGVNGEQVITTDHRGFRTTKKIEYGKNEKYRIVAIGASTTEQIYLDDRHTWTHLLQERLSKNTPLDVEVINTGVSGLRIKQNVVTLRNVVGLHPLGDGTVALRGVIGGSGTEWSATGGGTGVDHWSYGCPGV